MEETIKKLINKILDQDESERNTAEAELKALEKDLDSMKALFHVAINEEDLQIHKSAATLFIDAIEKNWNASEFKYIVKKVEDDIFELLLADEKFTKLLTCIFNNPETLIAIKWKSMDYLANNSLKKNRVALIVVNEVSKSSSLRYKIFDKFFDLLKNIFKIKFREFIDKKLYSHAAISMKIVANAYYFA